MGEYFGDLFKALHEEFPADTEENKKRNLHFLGAIVSGGIDLYGAIKEKNPEKAKNAFDKIKKGIEPPLEQTPEQKKLKAYEEQLRLEREKERIRARFDTERARDYISVKQLRRKVIAEEMESKEREVLAGRRLEDYSSDIREKKRRELEDYEDMLFNILDRD